MNGESRKDCVFYRRKSDGKCGECVALERLFCRYEVCHFYKQKKAYDVDFEKRKDTVMRDCFAYTKDENGHDMCDALRYLVCKEEKCAFYKHRDDLCKTCLPVRERCERTCSPCYPIIKRISEKKM